MKNKSFNQKCYELLRSVPKGKITTYKALANALNTKAYRAVGNAMRDNPDIPKTPCHRVINSNGELGGYVTGLNNKITMLAEEGIQVKNGKVVDYKNKMHNFYS